MALTGVCVVGLALLTAGCGGAKNVQYSPADVQSAFAKVGLSLYGPRQSIPDQAAFAQQPAPKLRKQLQPLPSLLKGVRDTFLLPSLRHGGRSVTLRGLFLAVYIYPRAQDAQRRARSYADILGAEQILHLVGFGYVQKGNVVVNYRVIRGSDRVPGFLEGTDNNYKAFDRKLQRQIATALRHLR